MRMFNKLKFMFKYIPQSRRDVFEAKSKDVLKESVTYASGYAGLPKTNIAFTPSGTTIVLQTPRPIDKLLGSVADKIDEKGLSDYEFREWLRDNLSSCEYQSESGTYRYTKTDGLKPISVIDTMLEVK